MQNKNRKTPAPINTILSTTGKHIARNRKLKQLTAFERLWEAYFLTAEEIEKIKNVNLYDTR